MGMITPSNSSSNGEVEQIRKLMRDMKNQNIPMSSGVYDQLQQQLNDAQQRQMSKATYLSAGTSTSLAADWEAYRYKQAQYQQLKYQPNTTWQSAILSAPPTSQKPSKPMNTEPQFEVGDIIIGTRFGKDSQWRIVRVNTSDYRIEPLNNLPGESWNPDNIRFGNSELKYVTLYESASSKAKVDFDSVIIADEKRQQILEALEQINQSDLIFKVWGFGETMEKGKGVAMLFYGQPGTGKTLMAQAIASKLGYKLKVISTADVESSAPGEAERNIRKHFKEAKGGKTILLFDECDSLIYSRQYVGAIMSAQINELLSQIERFDGITLFTTNRLGTLDEAVNRRLALKLEFEMPSPAERVEIWKRMFPAQAPLSDDIDWLSLAGVELTGGYIKNCVLRAARAAATEKCDDSKKQITMAHLVAAVTAEATSMADFEAAREEHASGYAHVSAGRVRGHGSIQRVQA